MKKGMFVLSLLLSSVFVFAQKIEDIKGDYVQYKLAPSKLFSAALKIWVVTNDKGFFLKDSSDKEIEAKTFIESLNLFSDKGWEYVSRYTETDASGKSEWILLKRRK